jgi:hypothetical protein
MLRVVHDGCEADLVGECRFDLSDPAERQARHFLVGPGTAHLLYRERYRQLVPSNQQSDVAPNSLEFVPQKTEPTPTATVF